MKALLVGGVRAALGPDFDVATHFTPRYAPWDQRLCLVPNGDLFDAIRSGRASVVTDEIATFTETGIALKSGAHLDADIIVTATGLNLVRLGEVDIVVDGAAVDFSKTWTYKGFAYSDVPNLALSFGYINASWTLRSDLIAEYVCRLLNHMARTGTDQCTPRLRATDRDMPARPWIEHFSSGYVQRVLPLLPRQGDREPWINPQNYARDRKMFRKDPVDDGVMQFTKARSTAAGATVARRRDSRKRGASSAVSPRHAAISPQPPGVSLQPSASSPQPSAISPRPSALSRPAVSPQPSSPRPSAHQPWAGTTRPSGEGAAPTGRYPWDVLSRRDAILA